KIGSGNVTLTLEPVVLQNLVEEVRATLGPLAESKGLQFNVTVPQSHVTINTDRRALTQILLSLTNNDIKFTDYGQVGIDLACETADGQLWAQVSVHDTGVGIRPEDQPKLFHDFALVERIGRRRHEGTGLSLLLSWKLAELLKGEISFKSEYGKGSTFT